LKIKKILLIALVVSLPVFTAYLWANQDALDILINQLQRQEIIVSFILSTIILMTAHVVRAYKTKLLTDTIKKTALRTHIRALFIGYLFNALLPLRIGEFIRAIVLGKGTRMSASFMFGLVVLDRATDLIILGLITFLLIMFTHFFDSSLVHDIFLTSSVLLIVTGTLLLAVVFIVRKQPPYLLKFWHRFTILFNIEIRDSLRFKLWSLMYGLERVLKRKYLVKYFAMSCVMWVLYLVALFPLIITMLPDKSMVENTAISTTSYLGAAAPAGPGHIGSYEAFVQPFIDASRNERLLRDLLALTWLLQVIPALTVGLIFVLRTRETLERTRSSSKEQLTGDKLLRDVDITRDLSSFLDAFFTNNSLSRIMHRFEVDNSSKLVHYFKGGSNAITALIHENERFIVRKITPIQYKYKLKSQHDWLASKGSLKKIVNVINEETTDDYYKIDLEFKEEYLPFFDYIHSRPQKKSSKILTGVFDYLFKYVYEVGDPQYRPKDLSAYLEDRCLSKIRQAAEVNDEIRSLLEYDTLVINGQSYRNIPKIIDQIKEDGHLKKILATYRKSSVHGDTTIDNILASKVSDDFLLIDPTDNENEISGPVFDFGRMTQSLRYGYEFLCKDERKVDIDRNHITFENSLSSNYATLHKQLVSLQKKYLTHEEQVAVPFHAAVLYSRMLTHRVVINPVNAAKFYAVSVIAFNNFLEGTNKK
jgi:uncharacterized protein (TIRG00374 family)